MSVTGIAITDSPVRGQFAAQTDIEDQFGKVNVATWSQLDNALAPGTLPVADANRILRALQWADAKIIHAFAQYGNYQTPFAPGGNDALLVTRWAAILSGTWLYLSRGLRDGDVLGNHLKKMQDDTLNEIARSRGSEKLDAARRWPTSTAPVASASSD